MMKNWLSKHFLFVLTVVLPTLLAVVYYGLVASDVYISESRFVVRSPQRPSQTGLSLLLQGSSFTRSQDDTYSVHDYMLSRDALKELDQRFGVRKAYSSRDIDITSRFPGLDWDDSFEALHRYYQKRVTVDFDSTTSITVVRVRTFKPELAVQINTALLQMGERLVNNLNDRSRNDLVVFAQREVKASEDAVKETAQALSAYRRNKSVFEPDRQASLQLQGVAKIQEELIATEGQVAQLKKLSPTNPQIGALNTKIETLRRAIASESAKVTGPANSLSERAPDFERLALEKQFADKQHAAALAALESARSEAQRKQLYLERIVEPHLPDESVEPRRIRSIFTVLILGLVAWGVLGLLLASVREHQD